MKICSIIGCEKKHKAFSYCSLHYRRFKSNGLTDRPKDGKLCAAKDCDKKCTRNLYCDKHYYRFKKYGNPDIVKSRYQKKDYTLEQLFLNSFIKKNEDACWEWRGPLNDWGYGRLNHSSHHIAAHRFSYQYFVGDFEESLFVCHHCDNPKCVNPNHLFLGDAQTNMDDMVKKGRHIGNSKLSPEQVIEIKKRLANGESRKLIAKCYDVQRQAIDNIANNKSWKKLLSN